MNKRDKRLVALLFGLLLVLFSFQNCGRSGFQTYDESEILNASLTGTGLGGKAASSISFDVGLDAIAYNSCVSNSKNAPGNFTLKASAGGSKGGVRLTSDFLITASSTLYPIQGNAQVLDVQYKQLLETSNPGAEAQVALRSTTDLRAAYTGSAQGGIWGSFDYLTDDSWLTPVVESARRNNNAWVGYSNRAPTSKSRLDFNFMQDFSASDYWSLLLSAQSFRNCAAQGCQGYGQFHIAVGFSEEGNRGLIKSPVTYNSAQTRAYGRAYQMQFGYPDNQPAAGLRVIKGIQEYSMQTGNVIVENNAATRWSCTEIPIMSSAQRGPSTAAQTSASDASVQPAQALCNPMSGSMATQFYAQFNLEKIRQFLPPGQWQLGYQVTTAGSRLCVIPVGFDCYPNETFPNYQIDGSTKPYPYYVEYNSGQRCINEDNMGTELTRVDQAALNRVCAHYITVCTKQ